MGRLAAWLGHAHRIPPICDHPLLAIAWNAGVEAQCAVMSVEAAKVPLQWADQKNSNRAD